MTTITNNAVIAAACTQRLTALEAHVPAKTEIEINGGTHKPADLIAIYQASLDTRAALVKSRAQVKADIAARRAAEASRVAIEQGLQTWVIAKFGADSNVAHEFGYAPRRKGVRTAETVANAVKLAGATREARHTLGKKQKRKIKGTLVAPTAPAAPAVVAPPVTGEAKVSAAPASPPVAPGQPTS